MWPDRMIVEAKTGRDRPIPMAGRFITRDEATAAALVIGAAFGIAVVVVLALFASSRTDPTGEPLRVVVATTQERQDVTHAD